MKKLTLRRAAAGQQYAIIVGLIAVVALLAITAVGGSVGALMTRTANTLSGVTGNSTGTTGSTGSGGGGGNTVDMGITGGLTAGNPARYADNTLATSCATYRTPTDGHTYTGVTGDGVYRIDADGAGAGAPVNVTCAMTTDGGGWTLIYDLDLPAESDIDGTAGIPAYTVNNSSLALPYARVAYFYTLGSRTVWTSFDKFESGNLANISLPVDNTYDQAITNLNVISSASGVTAVTGTSGWMEFWSHCYSEPANNGIGGNSSNYDIDDTPSTADCYGSMQVHEVNSTASRRYTVWAYNGWSQANTSDDFGIGANPAAAPCTATQGRAQPDWTFCANSGAYASRNMKIYVR